MGLADKFRIMLGHLTPDEQAERDAAARRRTEAADLKAQRRAQSAERVRVQAAARTAVQRQHQDRIRCAAAISSVELICHADTLRMIFVETRGALREYSGAKDMKELDQGRRSIRLSGRELAVILEQTAYASASTYRGDADRAVALQIYRAVGRIVDQADPNADPALPLPPIVIDAGLARRSTNDEDQTAGAARQG